MNKYYQQLSQKNYSMTKISVSFILFILVFLKLWASFFFKFFLQNIHSYYKLKLFWTKKMHGEDAIAFYFIRLDEDLKIFKQSKEKSTVNWISEIIYYYYYSSYQFLLK